MARVNTAERQRGDERDSGALTSDLINCGSGNDDLAMQGALRQTRDPLSAAKGLTSCGNK